MEVREVIDTISKTKYKTSFFADDSIEIVRQQIAKSTDSHPDRLFILVGINFPKDYYKKNPQHWEALFERLSYNGQPLNKIPFQEYQLEYRFPNTSIPFEPYDRAEWMSYPESLKPLFDAESEFMEYHILGVEELKSFVVPLNFDPIVSKIPAARFPIPQNTMLLSSYWKVDQIERFLIRQYSDQAEGNMPVYYPLFRTTTPAMLSDETIRLIDKNSKLLEGLLSLKYPAPSDITVIRTRFYVPWITTDFGTAVRTRFEQIFYGLTVSKETPYIGLFTSKEQVSRHKFFVEDPNNKKQYVDMTLWNAWWSLTKPSRNIPTLVLFRGTSKHDFDRVAITEKDMVISTHRAEGNTESLKDLQKSVMEWVLTFDAVIPFVDESDLVKERWDLQDLSFYAKYSKKIEDFDLRRMNCLSTVFDIADKSRAQFSLLRSDHVNDGITAVEVKLLQMIRDNLSLNPQEISEELSIPVDDAKLMIRKLENRLDEDPSLADKAFRGYPTIRVGPDFVVMSSISNLEMSVEYASILRYILSNPDADDVEHVCPKRRETITVESAVIPTTMDVDSALVDEYSDLFGYAEQDEDIKTETETLKSEEDVQKISTVIRQGTIYNYFKNRLQQFDPETFDSSAVLYPKKCEQKHQPLALNEEDIERLKGTPYDPQENLKEDQILDYEKPDGKIICPEFWCMRDQIPLKESQLIKEDGISKCPVCKGKLQTTSSDDPREFPLVKRETGFVYPGFVDYKSPKNGRQLPCCFKKSRAKKNLTDEKTSDDKYYILTESKTDIGEFRVAYLPSSLIDSLKLGERYTDLGGARRLQNGMKGFFRVGMGSSSLTLPKFLNLKTKIPNPRDAIDILLKCSFVRTWKTKGEAHLSQIESSLKNIEPFKEDTLARENMARIVSGIDEAFENEALSESNELEYSAMALNCDVFRISLDTSSMSCMFHTRFIQTRSRGIIVLQMGDSLDILTNVTRIARGFEYNSNIFEAPFKKDTYVIVEKLRNDACHTEVPSFDQAFRILPDIMKQVDADDFSVIMDPFGRAQAFYVPSKIILPFQPAPLPDMVQSKISGYSEIREYPTLAYVQAYLKIAEKTNMGYQLRDVISGSEVLTASGLRIPIKADNGIVQTVAELGESKLALGQPSEELKEVYREISYGSEVYEFLIFQLTNDLESDYRELRNSLLEIAPKQSEVEPLLKQWISETVQFVGTKQPMEFLSKIRTPCGQFKSKDTCAGNMCGWDGKVCRIQINDSIKQEKIFHRLLSTLLDNSKIRSIILDGRTTPFFSTILYLELPHELILTDSEL